MKIKYFGTAAAEGWPGTFCRCEACRKARELGGKNIRTRSQALIDDWLLVDFPPDTYLHMLYGGLDLPSLRHCIITHTHEDHFYPEDLGTRGEGYAVDPLPGDFMLYGNDEMVRRMMAFPPENRDRVACRELTEFVPAAIGDFTVTPLLARHNPKEKCFIYQIERGGKRMLYANDTGVFPQATWERIAGVRFDFVSLDCTMLALHNTYYGHMSIEQVVEVKKRMLEMGCADADTRFLITHFSHNGLLLHDELVKVMAGHGFEVAYDGLTVVF